MVRRGSLTVWFTDEAIAAWQAEARTTPGGQPQCSDLADHHGVDAARRLALRQTEGLIASIVDLLGLDLAVLDHSTLSRRARTLPGSNTIGNVPTVMLLLAVLKNLPAETLYALAVLSTLASNLLVVGSLANIIVVEQARQSDVVLGFVDHARCGVSMMLLSFAAAVA